MASTYWGLWCTAFVHQERCRAGLLNELAAMTRQKSTVTPTERWRPTQCNKSKSCQKCDSAACRHKVPLLGSKYVPKLSSWLCDRRQCSMGRKGFRITPVLRRTRHSVWDRVAVPTVVSSMDKCPNYETHCSTSAYGIGRNKVPKFNNFGVRVLLLVHSRKLILLCDVQEIVLSYIMTCRRKVALEINNSNSAGN